MVVPFLLGVLVGGIGAVQLWTAFLPAEDLLSEPSPWETVSKD